MAIANVVHRGLQFYVYDERGRQLCTLLADNSPGGGLVGYTSSSISIKRGLQIYTYDERGRQIGTTLAR